MLMMLAFPALAEPYTFSNGAQWGMSKAEIVEIEKRNPMMMHLAANMFKV